MRPILLLLFTALLTGCGNMHLKIKQPTIITAGYQGQGGSVTLKVADQRWTNGRIGALRGGFGNELRDIYVADDLTNTFTSMLTQVLGVSGFTVVTATNALVEAKITMFVMDTTGYGKFARHKVQMQLRDINGDIHWEKTFLGEAAGAAGWRIDVTASMEDCMNLALERLLIQAANELSAEFFHQQVRKINLNQP